MVDLKENSDTMKETMNRHFNSPQHGMADLKENNDTMKETMNRHFNSPQHGMADLKENNDTMIVITHTKTIQLKLLQKSSFQKVKNGLHTEDCVNPAGFVGPKIEPGVDAPTTMQLQHFIAPSLHNVKVALQFAKPV
jgi:hypothetical protein